MTKHNPSNERIKRQYFTFLKEAKRHSEATVDAAAEALARFETATKHRDFKAFHFEQAVAFKNRLAAQRSQQSGKPLSKATRHATLTQLKRFFQWLAGQPGYKSRLKYSDAEYFNLSDKDTRVATARRETVFPTEPVPTPAGGGARAPSAGCVGAAGLSRGGARAFHAPASSHGAGRRTAHGCAHDGIGDEVWAVWLSPDHGAVTGRGLARESQARGTVVASGRVESAAETAETRPLVAGGWVLCAPPSHIRHHVWAYDFVAERTHEGRPLKILAVVDEYSRECLALVVARRLRAMDVLETLAQLFVTHGVPAHIRSDNGPEFTADLVRSWLEALDVATLFIEPGSPWENGYVESFNGKLRDELLDREIFYTLTEARIVIERWRREYNTVRPHSALGYRPPAPQAVTLTPISGLIMSPALS